MSEPILRTRNSGFSGSGYAVPTDIRDGKPRIVPGVTTITGVTHKEGLIQWTADQVAAKAVTSLEPLLNRTEEEGFRYLRYASSYALKEAARNGTVVHEWIEAFTTGGFEPEIENIQQEEMVLQFLDWWKNNDTEIILTEATVYNPGPGYAGTADGLWTINSVKTMLDVKTGKHTYPEHWQQLAALGAAPVAMRQVAEGEGAVYDTKSHGKTYWVEDVLPSFEEYAILRVRPNDYDASGEFKPAFCELKKIEQWRIDLSYDGFLGALELKKSERKIKEKEAELQKEIF